jgi:hypothetical protein
MPREFKRNLVRIVSSAIIVVAATSACKTQPTGSNIPPTGPQTYTLYLERQQVWQGIIPYMAKFPSSQPPYGTLTGFQNPNLYPLVLASPRDSNVQVQLGINGSSSPVDVDKLYGSETPALPVSIIGVPQIGGGTVFEKIPIVVFYKIK